MIHAWIRRVPSRWLSDPVDHGQLFHLKMDEINNDQATYLVSVDVGHYEPPDHFLDFTRAKLRAWLDPIGAFDDFNRWLDIELPVMDDDEKDWALQFALDHWQRVIALIQGPDTDHPNFRFAGAGGVRDLLIEFVATFGDNLRRPAPEWAPVGDQLYVLTFEHGGMQRSVTLSADWIWTLYIVTRAGETGYHCLACPNHDRNGLDDFVDARRAWNHLVQALDLQLADPSRRR